MLEIRNLHARAGEKPILRGISLTVNQLFVGVPDGPGFRVTGGQLAVAMIKPAVADGRSWLALNATLTSAQLEGIDGVTLGMTAGELKINRGTGAAPLNWASAIQGGPISVVDQQRPQADEISVREGAKGGRLRRERICPLQPDSGQMRLARLRRALQQRERARPVREGSHMEQRQPIALALDKIILVM